MQLLGQVLITFFSENAYRLVKQFKLEKQKDLAELRMKQQAANAKNILIEDLVADEQDTNYDDFNAKFDEKLNEILHRKLSNAFMNLNDQSSNQINDHASNNQEKNENNQDSDQEDSKENLNQSLNQIKDNDSTTNLKNLIKKDENLRSEYEDQQQQKNKLKFDHKLPFYASTNELLDSDFSKSYEQSLEDSFGNIGEHSSDSLKAIKCELNPQFEANETNRTKNAVFESSLSSSSCE